VYEIVVWHTAALFQLPVDKILPKATAKWDDRHFRVMGAL